MTLGQWTAVSAAAAAQPVHLFVDEGWHLLPPDRTDLYKTEPEQQRRAALARGATVVD